MVPADKAQHRLIIRADGSAVIGLGHLVRSMALAEMVAPDMSVSFVCREIPEAIAKDIEQRGFHLQQIEAEAAFLFLIKAGDVVLLDGYHFTFEDQWRIKNQGAMLAVIDDLYLRPLLADLVINQSPGATTTPYQTPPYTRWALGLNYALIRPAFLQLAQKNRNAQCPPRKVMITFGGADPKKLTEKCAQILARDPRFEQIVLVIGAAYGESPLLKQLAREDDRIIVMSQLQEDKMCSQMAEADLIIAPASGVLIEALAAGAHVVCGHYADNQVKLHQEFKRLNAFVDAEDFSEPALISAIEAVWDRPMTPLRLIDGKSGERLSKLLKELAQAARLTWQRADHKHLDITYRWASDERMRAFSFNNNPIAYTEHQQWFEAKIIDPHSLYLIAYWEDEPMGSIRFDARADTAIISYQVDPAYQGRGFGVSILAEGMRRLTAVFPDIRQMSGRIMPENKASIAAFCRLGFIQTTGTDEWTLTINRPLNISSFS